MNLYCFPGMGTDGRVFAALAEQLQPDINLCVWEYIEPLTWNEPLDSYIERFAEHWGQPAEPPLVLGMSLGGLLAAEWCKRFDYQRLFLVSTMHLAQERPAYFPLLRRLPLHRLLPAWLSRVSWGRWGKWLGITDAAGQALLRDMINAASSAHLRWGRHTAVNWQNRQALPRTVRIHGTRDHVFPFGRVAHCDYVIDQGTHCAIFNNADQIARILRQELLPPEPKN